MADLPLALDGSLADRLAHALDQEAKIPRALEALGPVADRDVALMDGGDGLRAAQLPEDIAAAERLTRPGGRVLLVHDYGRDDVSRLLGEPNEPLAWSRRDGPFLGAGFRIRVVHCFWTFEDLAALRGFLTEAFGSAGAAVADTVHRPRLSYNVAVYHRTVGADR